MDQSGRSPRLLTWRVYVASGEMTYSIDAVVRQEVTMNTKLTLRLDEK